MILVEFVYDYFVKIILAYVIADFIAGIYHWIKDTYFSPFTPIIGKTFIWGSRLHHVRPRYVLEFNDWQLFVTSAKWTFAWMAPLFYFFGITPFLTTFFLTMSINDIVHKYAHLMDYERPHWATFLQRIYVFQSHEEHHLHHVNPHEINYCPISPFVNIPLEHIDFWRRLEHVVEQLTGIKPRAVEYDFVEDPDYPAGVRFVDPSSLISDQ